jgi:hypothetical protein
MLFDLFELLGKPEDYVCYWSNGELYIKPATGVLTPKTEPSCCTPWEERTMAQF